MRSTEHDRVDGSDTVDREILVSRVVSAPPEVVFEAFTEVRHLSQWWGPDGFTTTTHSFDFRVDGVWHFTMHGPDGTDFPEWITWLELSPPDRIVLRHGEHRDDPHAFETVLTFDAQTGGSTSSPTTLVQMRTIFPTRAQRDEALHRYHAEEGGQQTLASLAGYVTGPPNPEGDQ
jgi:uncharacterized protein YndB with AHSA1/START domain